MMSYKHTFKTDNGKIPLAVPNTLKSALTPQKQAFTPALDIHVNIAVTNTDNDTLELSEYLQEVREQKYKLRSQIGELFKRVEPCGRYRTSSDSNTIPVAKSKYGSVSFHGLQTCKSVWACPVCSYKITAKRAIELQAMFETAVNLEYKIGFLTLTVPHRLNERLNTLHSLVSNTWRKVTESTAYKGQQKYKGTTSDYSIKNRYGIAGFVRAAETKHGQHGWHSHLHICIAFNKEPIDLSTGLALPLEQLGDELINLWSDLIYKASGKEVNKNACDFQIASNIGDLSEYILKMGKWTLAKELTQAHAKTDKHPNPKLKSYTPFELIEKYFEAPEANTKYLDLFTEYVNATHRQNALTFSRGFKALFAPDTPDLTDEQILNEDIDTIILEVEALLHRSLVQKHIDGAFLNVIEYNPDTLTHFLDKHYRNRYLITETETGNTLIAYTEDAKQAIQHAKQRKKTIKLPDTAKNRCAKKNS